MEITWNGIFSRILILSFWGILFHFLLGVGVTWTVILLVNIFYLYFGGVVNDIRLETGGKSRWVRAQLRLMAFWSFLLWTLPVIVISSLLYAILFLGSLVNISIENYLLSNDIPAKIFLLSAVIACVVASNMTSLRWVDIYAAAIGVSVLVYAFGEISWQFSLLTLLVSSVVHWCFTFDLIKRMKS